MQVEKMAGLVCIGHIQLTVCKYITEFKHIAVYFVSEMEEYFNDVRQPLKQ